MAIFHLRVRTMSRANGASAAAAANYMLRLGKYSKASLDPCVFSHAGNMPAWASNPRQKTIYWQTADERERINGRLCKTLELALPRELNHAQRVALALEFCTWVARTNAGEPLPFLAAIHSGKQSNPHLHLIISERILDGHDRTPETWFSRAAPKDGRPKAGGARKDSSLKPRHWLINTRELLGRLTNEALSKAGSSIRIDHRSLAAQGIDRIPSLHLGPAGARLKRGAHSQRAQELAEELASDAAAHGLIAELQRESSQVAVELAKLQVTASPSGTDALLAKAQYDRSREKSNPKRRGSEHEAPSIR